MLSALKTIDRRLARLEDLLIMVMMATLALVLGLGVVLRYVFNNPLTWSEEIVVTFFCLDGHAGRTVCFTVKDAHSNRYFDSEIV